MRAKNAQLLADIERLRARLTARGSERESKGFKTVERYAGEVGVGSVSSPQDRVGIVEGNAAEQETSRDVPEDGAAFPCSLHSFCLPPSPTHAASWQKGRKGQEEDEKSNTSGNCTDKENGTSVDRASIEQDGTRKMPFHVRDCIFALP